MDLEWSIGPTEDPPSSTLTQRLQLVGTVRAIKKGFSSREPSAWVGANGQEPEVEAGMGMELGWG